MIEIPRNALVVLCGPSGCGKSHFAAERFKPSQIVSSDRCRELISDDETNQGVSHLAFELLMKIVDLRLTIERLTVADSTALPNDIRRDYRRLAQNHKAPVVCLAFDLPLDTCLRQNAQRSRRVDDSVVIQQWNRMQEVLKLLPAEGFDAVHAIRGPVTLNFVPARRP